MEKNNNFSQESDGVSTFVAGLTGTLEQNIRDEMNKRMSLAFSNVCITADSQPRKASGESC